MKNAIVTGATKGIGKAIALKLAQEGFNLAICGRNKEELDALVIELKTISTNINVYAEQVDLSIKENCQTFGKNCLNHFESINLLVNNAGYYVGGDICNEADGQLEMMLHTNVMSAYHLTRTIVPNMKNNKQGCIINIGSVAGLKAYTHGGSYSISKFALVGFSKNLREELKPFGIKVSTINPGATMSNSWAGSGIEAARIMEANDIAEIVRSICKLSNQAVLEDITLRPLLGDL